VPAPRSPDPAGADVEAAISIRRLAVRFKDVVAVDGLDLDVPHGRITAVLGPNGAGKSTTLSVVEGLRRADSGQVRVLGTDPWRASAGHRARVGVMLQNAGVPSGMRARDAISAAADLAARPYPVDALARRLGVESLGRRPFRRLSGGEQQRVALAAALVGRPDLLILDEPTAGLDPAARRSVWSLLTELRDAGTTVLVTTHRIEEAEALADRVALVAAGRCVASGPPAELIGPLACSVRFTLASADRARLAPEDFDALVSSTAGRSVVRDADQIVVSAAREEGLLDAVVAWSRSHGATLTDITTSRRTLEDAVLDLVDWDDDDA
jgi:ABC-2 type transport system ATP-binding protein